MHFLLKKDVPFTLTDHRMKVISQAPVGVTRPADAAGSQTLPISITRTHLLPVFTSLFFILDSSGAASPDQLSTKLRSGCPENSRFNPLFAALS